MTTPAWGVFLNANVNPHENTVKPEFVFHDTIFIEYPDGGKIKDDLRGKNLSLEFTVNDTTPGVDELIYKLNRQLLDNLHSTAKVTDLDMRYSAKISDGREGLSSVEYNIVFKPTITNITSSRSSVNSTVIDSQWRSFFVNDPVVIETNGYGKYDINNPLSVFEKLSPEVYQILVHNAINTLNFSMIDARDLSKPISDWQLGCNSNVYYGRMLSVPTIFSMETESYRENFLLNPPVKSQMSFTADKTYHIQTFDEGSKADILIDGYVRPHVIGNTEYLESLPSYSNQFIDPNKDMFGSISTDCTEMLTVQSNISKLNNQLLLKTILTDTRGYPLSNVSYEMIAKQDNKVILQSKTSNSLMNGIASLGSANPIDVELKMESRNHGLRGTFSFQIENDGSMRFLNPQTEINNTNATIPIYGPGGPIVTIKIATPLKQLQHGIASKDVTCWQGLQLILKSEDGSPACVKPQTAQILVERDWGHLQ